MEILKFGPMGEEDLNRYAAHIHELNLKWWTNPDGTPKNLDKGERFMLMVSELAEAMEGDRKSLADDHLPQYPMIWVELADFVIRVLDSGYAYGWDFSARVILRSEEQLCSNNANVGSSLLDIVSMVHAIAAHVILPWEMRDAVHTRHQYAVTCVTRAMDLAQQLGCLDFWQVVYDKLVYNWSRADHAHENRQGLSGQKRY